jgi:hypothetical protein
VLPQLSLKLVTHAIECNSDMIASETSNAVVRAARAVHPPPPEPIHHRRLFYIANRVPTSSSLLSFCAPTLLTVITQSCLFDNIRI